MIKKYIEQFIKFIILNYDFNIMYKIIMFQY